MVAIQTTVTELEVASGEVPSTAPTTPCTSGMLVLARDVQSTSCHAAGRPHDGAAVQEDDEVGLNSTSWFAVAVRVTIVLGRTGLAFAARVTVQEHWRERLAGRRSAAWAAGGFADGPAEQPHPATPAVAIANAPRIEAAAVPSVSFESPRSSSPGTLDWVVNLPPADLPRAAYAAAITNASGCRGASTQRASSPRRGPRPPRWHPIRAGPKVSPGLAGHPDLGSEVAGHVEDDMRDGPGAGATK